MMDLFNEKMSQIKELDTLKQKVTEDILAYKLALKNGQIDLLNGEVK